MKKKKKKKKKREGRKANLQWLTMMLVVVKGKNNCGSWQITVAVVVALLLFPSALSWFSSSLSFLLCYFFKFSPLCISLFSPFCLFLIFFLLSFYL
jgi:hypothetical protein